jgi:PAS domain S-box-containing protein
VNRSAASEASRQRGLYLGSILLSLVLIALLAGRVLPRLFPPPFSSSLLAAVLAAIALAIGLHVRFLILVWREQRQTANDLSTTEYEFQAIFDSALDALLIIDDQGVCVEANPAALSLLGAHRVELVSKSIRNFKLTPLEWQRPTGDRLDPIEGQGEMQILRRDGRPVFVEYCAKTSYLPHRHFIALRDITARKSAEQQMATNLRIAESARAEADALRKTTLVLTQNLSMDYVLDTLLESLLKLIPCDSAQVLLAETEDRLFLARERRSRRYARPPLRTPLTWIATDHPPLMRVLETRAIRSVSDTADEPGWNEFRGHRNFRSWLCVPLVASESLLGLLSLGRLETDPFTPEHLRLAETLALHAAVAIQNARLYERAEIYGSELEDRVGDLERMQQALNKAEEHRASSEDKFAKVFRASPIAFSITTVEEGRIIDVNEAFERRYGYSRDELIGRTVLEVGVWENPEERSRMVARIREQSLIRSHATRLRKRSGEVVETIYSAQTIHLDGRQCILAVTEDVPDRTGLEASFKSGSTSTSSDDQRRSQLLGSSPSQRDSGSRVR